MAIDPKQITTDITLELDEEEISIADFQRAFDGFFGLVKEVTKAVAPRRNPNAWAVKVYEGSAGVGVSNLGSEFSVEEISSITNTLFAGLDALKEGARNSFFSDRAIEHAKSIANIFKGTKVQPNVRLWSKRDRALPISRALVEKATEILAPAYEEQGAVEGTLERLESHTKLQFVIYDVIDERAVRCEITEGLMEQAWKAWRQRVEVSGSVKYRKDGMPVSVKASKIIPFPQKSEIPTVQQMRALLG
ncbi:MAG: hypothetical protein ACRETW_12065 [Stenotrophobium sp.]